MTSLEKFRREVEDAASDFEHRGWRKVKIPFGEKATKSSAWQNADPNPRDFRNGDFNIGVQLGPKSGGLVDIDLDCPQAIELADQFFPELRAAAFGRLHADGRHTLGHRLLICSDIPEAEAKVHAFGFNKADEQAAIAALGLPKSKLVEFRAGKGYTGFPPSQYGEDRLTWRGRPATASLVPEIPELAFADAYRRAALLAFASLALAVYPAEGGRDDFCLQLAGALVHAKVDPGDAAKIIIWVATAAGDEEAAHRGEKARRTADKKADGEPVTNLSTFLAHVGLEPCEKAVRRWLGMAGKTQEARGSAKPKVEPDRATSIIIGENLIGQSQLIVRKLTEAGILLFRRDTEVLRLHRFKEAAEEGEVRYAANSTILKANDWRWIRTEVDNLIDFYVETNSGFRKVNAPIDSVRTLEDRIADFDFPELVGLSHVPTLERHEPGYDPVGRTFHTYNKGDFPPVPEGASKADAQASLARLLHHARAFPWKTDVDKSVYAAYLVTAVIRHSIAFAPVFGFSAPHPRSGKSKLAFCGGWLALGYEPPTSTFQGRKYEDNQTFWSMLSSGSPIIMYDNVELGVPFYNDAIAQALQSERVRARVLGESREILLPTRVLMAVTGNDLTSKKDMVERMLRCELDPKTEKPGERTFDFDPVAEVRDHRASLVVDALTVVKAYLQSGERVTVRAAMGGFEKWSELVREPLLWLGLADPLGSIKRLREDDETSTHELHVLAALLPRFGCGRSFTVGEVGTNEHTKRLLLSKCRNGRWENLGFVLRSVAERERGGIVLRRERDEVLGQFKFRIEGTPDAAMLEMAANMDTITLGNGIMGSGSGAYASG